MYKITNILSSIEEEHRYYLEGNTTWDNLICG